MECEEGSENHSLVGHDHNNRASKASKEKSNHILASKPLLGHLLSKQELGRYPLLSIRLGQGEKQKRCLLLQKESQFKLKWYSNPPQWKLDLPLGVSIGCGCTPKQEKLDIQLHIHYLIPSFRRTPFPRGENFEYQNNKIRLCDLTLTALQLTSWKTSGSHFCFEMRTSATVGTDKKEGLQLYRPFPTPPTINKNNKEKSKKHTKTRNFLL